MLLMWEEKVIGFVLSCVNFDDRLGSALGSASHAGQIYRCPGFLVVTVQLYQVNSHLLGWWFYERQLTSGGLNGRLEKLSAVCYSWWVLVSVKIAGSSIGLAETDCAVSCERVMTERLEILPIGQEVW